MLVSGSVDYFAHFAILFQLSRGVMSKLLEVGDVWDILSRRS